MVNRGGKRKLGNAGASSSSQGNVANNSENDDSDGDDELLSLMPKRVRDSENIINIAQSTRNLSRDQICLLFIEVAKRPDQNYEFDLAFWLQKFGALSIEPNFSEVALVLVYAGQIYCRKIDTLYDFIMKIHTQTGKAVNLCEQTKREAAEIEKALANNEPLPKKKRVVKKKKSCEDKNRTITNPFELFGGEMTPIEIHPSEAPLFETVVLKHKEKLDDSLKYLNSCERLKRKLMILKILKQARRRLRSKRPIFNCEFPVQSDNHDILNYANEELVDLDDEIVAGTRRDYFVFMGMINRKTHTLNLVHNFIKENGYINSSQIMDIGATLLPPEYVERVYNVKLRNPKNYYLELRKELALWDQLGPARHEERQRRCILIAYQKAVKMLDEKNVIEHLRTSNVITETQYNEAIHRLTEEQPCNDRTLSPIDECMDHMETALTQNENKSGYDSGIGTSINESQSFAGTLINESQSFAGTSINESQSFAETSINESQSFVSPIDLTNITNITSIDPIKEIVHLNDVINSVPCDSFSQSLSINISSQELNSTNKFSPAMIVEKLVNSELRISVDEGISCTSRTSSPLPRLSDLDPMTRSLLSPKVQLIDICDPFTDAAKIGLKIKLNQPENNIFYIENKMLHAECFKNYSVPVVLIPSSEVPINLNFLCLPEKMLRRKCKFALPNEFRAMKIRKTNQNLCNSMCSSPISVGEDFLGFDNDITIIYPNEKQDVNVPIIQPNMKNMRSFSQDSGVDFCSSPPHNSGEMEENRISQFDESGGTINQSVNSGETDENRISQHDKPLKHDNNSCTKKSMKSMFDDYDSENNIVERITEWYSHLSPILKASKERSYFDIHAYGSEILKTFPEETTTEGNGPVKQCRDLITFEELMSVKQKDCTARYFLSMLQLANNGNIEIIPPPTRCSTKLTEPSELKLRLLNREIQSEIMDDDCNFENYEPSSKKRKIEFNKNSQTVNPIRKIIKTCNKLQGKSIKNTPSTSRDSDKILKMIERYKNSPKFNHINAQNFTPDEVISIASRFNPNKSQSTRINSEFGDSGFQSMSSLPLTIGDG